LLHKAEEIKLTDLILKLDRFKVSGIAPEDLRPGIVKLSFQMDNKA
jgi:hypothetical protein